MQALTDLNPEATVVSIDGIGACDLISRNVVLEGLLQVENGDQVLPFAGNFYGHRLTYVRRGEGDEMGTVHDGRRGAGERFDAFVAQVGTTPCFRSQARL